MAPDLSSPAPPSGPNPGAPSDPSSGASPIGDNVAARFDTLLSTISAGVFETDTDGRVIYANPSTLRVLGFTAEQLIGRTPQELGVVRYDVSGRRIEPRDAPLATAGRDRVGTVDAIIRYSGLPVADVWLESQTTPLYGEDGRQRGNVVSFVDVTDRFRLEAERLAGQEQLHEVLAAHGGRRDARRHRRTHRIRQCVGAG